MGLIITAPPFDSGTWLKRNNENIQLEHFNFYWDFRENLPLLIKNKTSYFCRGRWTLTAHAPPFIHSLSFTSAGPFYSRGLFSKFQERDTTIRSLFLNFARRHLYPKMWHVWCNHTLNRKKILRFYGKEIESAPKVVTNRQANSSKPVPSLS